MSSNKLTKRGYERLRAEYDELSLRERPKVVSGIATAAAEGDRSENAEYIYGKKRLREIDKRLQYLTRLLKRPEVISKSQVKTNQVNFGCQVQVENQAGQIKTYTIVGDGEADLKSNTISINAPVAKALLGKQAGDFAEVELPSGLVELVILDISVGEID